MFVIYTNRFLKKHLIAMNLFFVILIRPEYRDKRYVHEHEKIHTKQVLKWWILQPVLYNFSKKWRLKFEVEAFKASVKYGRSLDSAASALSSGYGLGITMEEAKALIREEDPGGTYP